MVTTYNWASCWNNPWSHLEHKSSCVELLWKQFGLSLSVGLNELLLKQFEFSVALGSIIQSVLPANYILFHLSLQITIFSSCICYLEYAFKYYFKSKTFSEFLNTWVLSSYVFLLTPPLGRSLILGTNFLVTSFPQNSVNVLPLSSDI